MGPSPAVADVRNAVRESLLDLDPGVLVLAACSGGADSLSLAAALAFVAPRQRLRAGAVTVDHGLQPGSAGRARDVAATLTRLGLDPVECVSVGVPVKRNHGGPEAAARTARYEALAAVAERTGAAAVLLGHTLDDQAETVLLGLARGSGARALAGMAARRGRYRRPLLTVRRRTTRAACSALDLPVWDDPHNASSRFARARVRHEAMPALEAALGPGVAEALARTAGQLRADADFLDAVAEMEAERACGGSTTLLIEHLAALPSAIRTRVLHGAAVGAGCPAGSLTACHVEQLETLVTGWRGQRWIDLPGGVRGLRRDGQLRFSRDSAPAGDSPAGSGPMAGAANDVPGWDREGGHGRGRHGSRPEGGADQRGQAASASGGAGGAH
jgi:tRNA(Ile)-lysidine synthase